ncbi:IS110 family transposase [Ensifer adhaerens]|uniref:IS110 family transposase n=1 Tax=Ensifer adhaerens TaxID=106592 RepID=UPI00384EBCF7
MHRTRDLLVKQRTMSVNALRSHLAEFGIISAKGIGRIDDLLEKAEHDVTLPSAARVVVKTLAQQIREIDISVDRLEREIAEAHSSSDMSQLLAEIPGVGKLTATVIDASMPNADVFRSGRDFAAWLGLTPRQNSSGGKQSLGAITKQGNRYIRKLLVLAADKSVKNGPALAGHGAEAVRDAIAEIAFANFSERKLSPVFLTAQMIRASLFASATVTSLAGFLARSPTIQSRKAPFRLPKTFRRDVEPAMAA